MVSMKIGNILLLAIVVLSTTSQLLYPSSRLQQADKISSVKDDRKSGPVRIYYAKDRDSLPESFDLTGTIVEQTLSLSCGVVVFGGTLKIRPSQKIPTYSPEFVYVVAFCLSEKGRDFIGKTATLHVTKSYTGENPCKCELINNKIDSHGTPFYCAGDLKIVPN